MKMSLLLAVWFLVGEACAGTGRAEAGQRSVMACNVGLVFPVQQSQNSEAPPRQNQREQMLLSAKTVFIVVDESFAADSSSKAAQALRRAVLKWGRFQVIDDAATANLIITITDVSSSKRLMLERITVHMAVFSGGEVSDENATPLWFAEETGSAFGNKRPTRKLIKDLKRELSELERPAPTPNSSSKTGSNEKMGSH